MKLSISNIAWETPRMDEHLAVLREAGCDGMELSPSMIWQEPITVERHEILALKKKLSSFGLAVPSLHSLTYPRPDLTFFDSASRRAELIDYIVALGEVANLVEAPVMVFGSSRSRQIADRDPDECYRIMADGFGAMAARLQPLGVQLLIEPLSKQETDSINNLDEAYRLIEMVNHPGFGLHIDLKSSFVEGERQDEVWRKYGTLIRHCHVADPGLKPPSAACKAHPATAKAMREAGYDRYISIEMGRNFGETTTVVRAALAFVRQTYLEGP